MYFTKIMGFAAPIILAAVEKVDESQEKEKDDGKEKDREEYKRISIAVTIVCWIYSFVNIFCDDGIVFSALLWMQRHWGIAVAYILVGAILPSVVARKERRKGTFRANENYAKENLKLNLLGAAAACAVFVIIYIVVKDFSYLRFFYIEDLVPVIASVSVWMAIFYQKIERKKDRAGTLDHDASITHMNQKLNMLHLFNVFFLTVVAVVYIVAYTIYCQTYHVDVVVNGSYYLLISVALLFFYVLSQHPHRYLYLISLVFIPVILISSIYWMTWFSAGQIVRRVQWVYAFVHSMIYIFCIFRREKIVYIKKYRKGTNSEIKGLRIGKWEIMVENHFLLFLPVVVAMIYIIVYELPLFIERLPANEAYKYIDMICTDTEIDADDVVERSREQKMYDEANDSYDIEEFMKFMSDELGVQLQEKGIIEDSGDVPSRDTLRNRYMNEPRHINE